jgi:hypothetical protein
MDCLTILALTVKDSGEETAAKSSFVPIDAFWETITNLSLLEALTFIAFGVVCLFYGWRVFKALAIICFAILGLIGGLLISQRVGNPDNPLLAISLSIVMAVFAIPLMRWAVGILGAIAGGLATAGLWYAASLPEQYLWAGGITGVVAGGMISFIVFKIAVMLFTSMGGSALMISGLIALLQQYSETSDKIKELFFGPKWFLPAAIIIPTLFGLYWQNRFVKKSPEWTV